MKLSKKILNDFNHAETLMVLSSFPEKRGELAADNAIARYTNLLIKNFPGHQRVVVISEKRKRDDKPYLLTKNILVIPSYVVNSSFIAPQILRSILKFSRASKVLVQFEFSIFGGKRSIPGIVAVLMVLALLNKDISTMLHQVVKTTSSLSGHLGLVKGGLKSKVFDSLLHLFYRLVGVVSRRVLVHDSLLKSRLEKIVPEYKLAIIPHGSSVPTTLSSNIRNKTRKRLGFSSSDKVVLVFGYRSWYKGTDWAVKTLGEISRKYPRKKLKLLIAGGESPTLMGTNSYKNYSAGLTSLLDKYQDRIVTTGFVPEKDVASIFASADVVLYPYRTKMSASGALSLAWKYGKSFLVSKTFAMNFEEADIQESMYKNKVSLKDLGFELNQRSFERVLLNLLTDKMLQKRLGFLGKEIAIKRSWENVGQAYLRIINTSLDPRGRFVGEAPAYATK